MRVRSTSGWLSVFVLIIALGSGMTAAGGPDIDLQALTQETTRMGQTPKEIAVAWWIPEEVVAVYRAKAPQVKTREMDEFANVTRSYTVVFAIYGEVASGRVTYQTEDSIRTAARLVDSQGKSYAPRATEEVDSEAKRIIQILKPVFASGLGPAGQNMCFLLFPAKNDSGERIADAKGKGQFKVRLGEREFEWRLPIDALLPAKMCGVCKRECKGSWLFCPWCGAALLKGSAGQTGVTGRGSP